MQFNEGEQRGMGMDYHAIGKRIQECRKAQHHTQDHLAEALAVSVGYISQIERGVTKASLDTLSEIAAFLGCDITALLSGTSTGYEGYLEHELAALCKKMSPSQKHLLLEIANAISRQKEDGRK